MPVLDKASHETSEDLAVLRAALGPAAGQASGVPLHAEAMREMAAAKRRAALKGAAARRQRRLVQADAQSG